MSISSRRRPPQAARSGEGDYLGKKKSEKYRKRITETTGHRQYPVGMANQSGKRPRRSSADKLWTNSVRGPDRKSIVLALFYRPAVDRGKILSFRHLSICRFLKGCPLTAGILTPNCYLEISLGKTRHVSTYLFLRKGSWIDNSK